MQSSTSSMSNTLDLNEIMPAIITGAVAIVGFITQLSLSIYLKRRERKAKRVEAVNLFLIPLQKELLDLMSQCQFAGFSLLELQYYLAGIKTYEKPETLRKNTTKIYERISSLFASGSYAYINRDLHSLLCLLRNNVYSLMQVLDSSNQSVSAKEKALKKHLVPDVESIINKIDRIQKNL